MSSVVTYAMAAVRGTPGDGTAQSDPARSLLDVGTAGPPTEVLEVSTGAGAVGRCAPPDRAP